MEYVIQELRYKAKVFKETGLVSLNQGDVVKSDVAIPNELHKHLKVAVALLENDVIASQGKKREGVVKIVDPDHFNVVFGETKVIEEGALDKETCLQKMQSGSCIPYPDPDETYVGSYLGNHKNCDQKRLYRYDDHREYGSEQWLACEVDISGDTPR